MLDFSVIDPNDMHNAILRCGDLLLSDRIPEIPVTVINSSRSAIKGTIKQTSKRKSTEYDIE